MSTTGQISNLASVSKVLFDFEVLALSKENKELKAINEKLNLNLFWAKFNISQLSARIRLSNFLYPEAPDCNCFCCGIAGRLSATQMDSEIHNPICTFTPLLKNTFAYLGLKVVETMDIPIIYETQPLVHEYSWDFVNVDAHIVVEEDWTRFAYGSKFFNVTSMDDPALQKLRNLFEILEKEPMFPAH
jgi:hypothetical protein